jgi:hypothetical protein
MITRALTIIGVGLLLSSSAWGLTITQSTPDTSLANADWAISYPSSTVVAVGLKIDFLKPETLNSPVTLQFVIDSADVGLAAPKEIQLVNFFNAADPNAVATNLTGVPWTDFHFILVNVPLFSAGASFSNFAGTSSTPWGAPVVANATNLDFAGAVVASGSAADFTGITIDYNNTAGRVFYLKIVPTPEPATLTLLAVGAVALLRRRAR